MPVLRGVHGGTDMIGIGLGINRQNRARFGPNLLPNGNPVSGTTGWAAYNATISETAGVLRATASADGPLGVYTNPAIPAAAGDYRLNFTLAEETITGSLFLYVGTTPAGVEVGFEILGAVGPYEYDLTLPGSDIYYSFSTSETALAGQYLGVSQISLRKIL